jgi:septal ring factor EnvC (AmiA/AmiB activator)
MFFIILILALVLVAAVVTLALKLIHARIELTVHRSSADHLRNELSNKSSSFDDACSEIALLNTEIKSLKLEASILINDKEQMHNYLMSINSRFMQSNADMNRVIDTQNEKIAEMRGALGINWINDHI